MELSIASQEHGVTLVELHGKITHRDISPFDDPLGDRLGSDVYGQTVLISLQDVEILDSSGISWLLTCQRRFRETGGRLVLHSVSPTARNVFKVLNLRPVFEWADDELAAKRMVVKEPA